MLEQQFLKDCAKYVNDKISTKEILINQYITTDNIQQNKQGVVVATGLPAQNGKITYFKKGDILLANIRPYLKKIWLADFDGGCSADVLVIRGDKETDNHFLFYALFRDDFFTHTMKGAKGTKMPRGDKAQIMAFHIPKFDLTTQQKIASVLSSLDRKIALNNQINNQLEKLAKTLYDYWFVQFDFPNDNGNPYKSSGGKMAFNDILNREIPEGWAVGKMSEIAKTGSGGTPTSTNHAYYQNGKIPWINSGEVNDSIIVQGKNFITELGLKESSAKIFPKNTLLLAMYGATAGKVSLLTFEATTNQAICAIMPKQDRFLIYLKFLLEQMYQYLINLSSGSARDNLSQDKIKELQILIPSVEIMANFQKFTDTLFEKIIINKKQNTQLTQLRDWLLPMLMNGQITVT